MKASRRGQFHLGKGMIRKGSIEQGLDNRAERSWRNRKQLDIGYSQNQVLKVYEKNCKDCPKNSTVVGRNVGECGFIFFLVFQMGLCCLLLVYIF